MSRLIRASCRNSIYSKPARCLYHHTSSPHLITQLRTTGMAYDQSKRSELLGIRSKHPPDSNPEPEPVKSSESHLSDQDWEIRTGRAIDLLQQTLPQFFLTGLVTCVDKATGSPKSSSPTIPIINANPLDYQIYTEGDTEIIYSPKIGLSYTPPVALPPPFPTTLHIEGLPLYLASAVFVRHTLNALYSDLSLDLNKMSVNTPRSRPTAHREPFGEGVKSLQTEEKRQKSLSIGFSVTGKSRVSGARGEWEIKATYSFSQSTGLINKHIVNSIYPAPHQAVYDSLRSSLGKLFGVGIEGSPRAGPGGTACSAEGGNASKG